MAQADGAGSTARERPGSLLGDMTEVASVLYGREDVRRRVEELGRTITGDYVGREPVLVTVLTGGAVFLADLIRGVDLPVETHFMAISRYGDAEESFGRVQILLDVEVDLDIEEDLDAPERLLRISVPADSHEVGFDGKVDPTDQVGEEHGAAREDRNEHGLPPHVIPGDRAAELLHPAPDVLASVQDARDLRHVASRLGRSRRPGRAGGQEEIA